MEWFANNVQYLMSLSDSCFLVQEAKPSSGAPFVFQAKGPAVSDTRFASTPTPSPALTAHLVLRKSARAYMYPLLSTSIHSHLVCD